jgi:hypothetical protein
MVVNSSQTMSATGQAGKIKKPEIKVCGVESLSIHKNPNNKLMFFCQALKLDSRCFFNVLKLQGLVSTGIVP